MYCYYCVIYPALYPNTPQPVKPLLTIADYNAIKTKDLGPGPGPGRRCLSPLLGNA